MAFASSSTSFNIGDGSILGCFTEKDHKNLFEFSTNNTGYMTEYPHLVWVTEPRVGFDSGFRYATVKKTVVYIVVGEEDNGLVVEKWSIKDHRLYKPNN